MEGWRKSPNLMAAALRGDTDVYCNIEGNRVLLADTNLENVMAGAVPDHAASSILDRLPIDQIIPRLRKSDPAFLPSFHRTVSDREQSAIAGVWSAISNELDDGAPLFGVLGNGAERMIADLIILKFIRAHKKPDFVRGDIKAAESRVASLARKAQQISADVAKLADALKNENTEGIGATVFEADLFAAGVVTSICELQETLRELALKRDKAIDPNRRASTARPIFAREWAALMRELCIDNDVFEAALTSAVEAIEGEIGQGEREWVSVLIRDAKIGTNPQK